MSKDTLKLLAVLAFCLGVVFLRPFALIIGGAMLVFAVMVTIWSHWMAWRPGHKPHDANSPDQDIFHQP